jgi:hypothetical protein
LDILVKVREIVLKRLLEIWDGQIVVAVSLETAIADLDLSRPDTWVERLTAATFADFGDIPQALASLPDGGFNSAQRLAARLGWVVDTLINWDVNEDRSRLKVEAALAAAVPWDYAGCFWTALSPQVQGHPRIMAAFEVVLRSRTPQASLPHNTPVWEREHLHFLQEADKNGDWAELANRAQAFRNLPRLDPGARNATLALVLLDWPRLVRQADQANSWFHAHMLLEPLSLENVFHLATASRSGHVRFTALDRVANREVRSLTTAEENALRNLLIVLAKDESKWPEWLAICSRYPVQHPHIQVALGRALARCREKSLQAYVDSISLSTSETDTRELVTLCLQEFRSRARDNVRLALWQKAFHRWERWNFGVIEDQNLVAIARSAIDYAVVGWLVEGEFQKDKESFEQDFEGKLGILNLQWHRSFGSAISSFFRLISRHQVLAHAFGRTQSDPNWLPGPTTYVPAAAADVFVQRRYRWDGS